MEIRHVPSCYDKTQLPSLTSTQLVFFDEVHVKQVCGPPSTSHSNDKIWLCESVGKIKGIGKQEEVKMHEINVHTIADFQRYVRSYGLPKLSIRGLGQIYERALVALPRKPTPSVKDHRKARNRYYSRYGDRWVEKLK